MESTVEGPPSERRSEQYSLAKILSIWALATVPMGILGWIGFPLLAPDFETDPLESAITRVVLLTLGLIWLFVLSMIIVRQEEGDLGWATVKQRLRLNTPREPATGEPRPRLWLGPGLYDVRADAYRQLMDRLETAQKRCAFSGRL